MPASCHSADETPELDHKVVFVATWLASAFAAGLILIGLVGGDDAMLTRSIGPAITALVGWAMLELKRPNVAFHLLVGMASVAFMVAVNESNHTHDGLFGLLAMGVGGAGFVRRHVAAFVGIAAAAIAMAGYLHEAAAGTASQFQTAFGSAATYIFMAWLIIWMKGRWLDSQRELQQLIHSN